MSYHSFDLGRPLAKLWSTNATNAAHWSAHHEDKKLWRDGMTILARSEGITRTVQGRPCRVRFVFPVPDKRRRDPSNLVGTVVKWCVDGLVNGGVWPDDTPDFVTIVEPLLVVNDGNVYLDLWTLERER